MDESALKLISTIGTQLSKQTRPNKDLIVKSLRQAANALSQLEQPSSLDANQKLEDARKIEAAIDPLKKCITRGLLQHRDKDVKLLVAICVSETFRILAPDLPFEDEYLRDVFKLIISMFAELADTTSPYFSRRVKILETVSRCKCCVIMLDIDCNDLIMEMFSIFFSVVREHHQRSLINDILSIMTHILNEEATQPLLDVILQNLLKEEKETPSAASQLAISVIQTCAEKLGPIVCGFLTSCIWNRDAVRSEIKEFYHEIIFKISQCAPRMLQDVIPNMSQELVTDQVDVRIKALTLIGKLLSLPEFHIAQNHRDLFIEFLKRFADKSAEVRVRALQCARICYITNSTGTESHDVLSALEGRLLDFDDKVRMEAVIVACDLARSNLKKFPPKLLSQTTERLRDKKVPVRQKTLEKLLEVYRDYCNECSEGRMTICDQLEQIPCKMLMLYYDKDCKEFRPQNMELILVKDLFPALLSVEERTRHWVHLFSLFNSLHLKALNSILYQKGRLQNEMQTYLAFRAKEKENCSEEKQSRCTSSFMKMAASFADPSEAEKGFKKLNNMKENKVFNFLETLLKDLGHENAETTRDKLLNLIGDKNQNFEFLQTLSLKCSHNIFSSGHVRCILDNLSSNGFGDKHYEDSSLRLLLAVTSVFPKLLRGSEEKFQMLLKGSNAFCDKMIEVLVKAGPHISVKLSEIYPFLKRVCLEGTRLQSKFAVSAIAALIDTSKELIFSDLCKELVDSLHCGRNTLTVLQSLGCLAQHSVSTFEAHDGEITPFIYEKILQVKVHLTESSSSSDDSFGCSDSCKLKICGLKLLVKSFLPHHGAKLRRNIKELLDRLLILMRNNEMCSERNVSFLRLAAAKSVLRLSQRWDLYISPETFCSTVSMAKDDSSFVRRSFLDKTHTMLKKRAIPSRYACAYALASSDCLKDSYKYMAEFIKEYGREARQTTGDKEGLITAFPAYIVVFLIHLLAHDKDFPLEDCQNEELYAQFCSPLFSVLQALLSAINFDNDLGVVNDTVLYLLWIFRAIKRADDAVNIKNTSKLHILADIGLSFVNAVNQSGISASSPGHILLPSSLYRANTEHPKNNEVFAKKVVHVFQSHSSLPETNPSKRGRKYKGDCTQSAVIRDRNLYFPPCKIEDLPISKSAETEKNVKPDSTTRGRRKQAASVNASGSVQLHECSKSDHHIDASEKSESKPETEHVLPSRGSVPKKPLVAESHVSTRSMKRNAASLKGSGGVSNNSCAEGSKLNQAKLKDCSSLKETTDKGEALIGKRIKLLSPIERCFYAGTVDGYNSENNTHKIACDNGNVDLVCLDSESWETVGDESQLETVISAENSNALHLQCRNTDFHKIVIRGSFYFSGKKKPTDDTYSKIPPRPTRNVGRESEKTKSQKASVDALASKVIDTNEDIGVRRSRRRKA
ncbi:sister chromatid cohesion protein PDS5 homolog B isoform X2 [Humulus lupulus]|uniref:sister chromatid cohesion protein PDS5 homolog B isoform X2 n=1 Tax=Humulus lupulus TaxID=3486 RepID=UPI002B4078B2|nr:sister chromatid cohesion protein PDS5 homolog B isoform X2 [Humulus lupulus]